MTKTISEYAPQRVDPLKLIAMAPQAIGRIGEATAQQLEDAADAHERDAKVIADDMRKLAYWMRQHTSTLNGEVIDFCSKSVTVVEALQMLENRIVGNHHTDSRDPIPQFLQEQNIEVEE